jgi:hypothetical protein
MALTNFSFNVKKIKEDFLHMLKRSANFTYGSGSAALV